MPAGHPPDEGSGPARRGDDRSGTGTSDNEFGARVAAELPGLYRYAFSIAANRAEAEDVVGDTVVRALEHEDQYRGAASLRTWLHQILHHLVIDRARHGAHEVSVEEVEALWRDGDYSVDASVVAERIATAEGLRDALLHVPLGYRSVVVLHDAEGWTASEIATMVGISLPAAKQRLRRGRMMLVSALGHEADRRAANKGVPLACWQARQEVSAYLDGELGSTQRATLEAHLAGCSSCPSLYQALVGATDSLGALHDPDSVVPHDLAERVRGQVGLR